MPKSYRIRTCLFSRTKDSGRDLQRFTNIAYNQHMLVKNTTATSSKTIMHARINDAPLQIQELMGAFWTQLSLENSSDTLFVTTILSTLEHSTYSRSLEVWNCRNVARRASTPPKNDKGRPGEPHTIKQRASAPPKYDKGRAREVLLWMSYLDPLIIYSARTQPGNHFE